MKHPVNCGRIPFSHKTFFLDSHTNCNCQSLDTFLWAHLTLSNQARAAEMLPPRASWHNCRLWAPGPERQRARGREYLPRWGSQERQGQQMSVVNTGTTIVNTGVFLITIQKYGLITLLNPVCTASNRGNTPVGESVETGTADVCSKYRDN